MFISTNEELRIAIEKMQLAGTDLLNIEAKTASGGFPASTAESICAFANTSGGVIVFGINEKEDFKPVQIDVGKIQTGCAQAARELIYPAQAVDIRVFTYLDTPIVVANVLEASRKEKPCYIRKLGLRDGSYIRTGDGDHKMTVYEIDRFIENQNKVAFNDVMAVPEANLDELDDSKIEAWYQNSLKSTSFGRAETISKEALMANRRVIVEDSEGNMRPSLAGLLVFGKRPQYFYPRLAVLVTIYPNTVRAKANEKRLRYLDSKLIEGSISQVLEDTLLMVITNMKKGALIEGMLRKDIYEYPIVALREAITNALIHRDYSAEAVFTPISVEMYPDRISIVNPGGLFGSMRTEDLGLPGRILTRNSFLARILEDVDYIDHEGKVGRIVENRGTGFLTMQFELEKALMPPIKVKSDLSFFELTFRHRRMSPDEDVLYSRKRIDDAILKFLSTQESASAKELSDASGISIKSIRKYLSSMLERGDIEAIGMRNSPKRRYRLKV